MYVRVGDGGSSPVRRICPAMAACCVQCFSENGMSGRPWPSAASFAMLSCYVTRGKHLDSVPIGTDCSATATLSRQELLKKPCPSCA
eukprot:1973817-Pyramimonas_sp.AAC.1